VRPAIALRRGAAWAVRLPAAVGWRDHVIGATLAVIYVAWLLATAPSLGFPRDEALYFRAATQYAGWWLALFEHTGNALRQPAIDSAWGINHEHPALMKTLFGLSEYFLHQRMHVFADASTAYRFPGMASAGMAIWTTYLFGARAWTRRAGLTAAVLFALMPRVFFHAHLACFDAPIAAMWILCVYVHWRAQTRRTLGWIIAVGVIFGLALETKHNAWMLPAVLVPHAMFVHGHASLRELAAGRMSLPASIASMAIIGPLVFYALWPYVWHDTFARVEWYVDFHLNHEYYNIEYLGKNYFGPPSPKSYLPVMVAATVPTVTLLLFGIGCGDRAVAGARRLVAGQAGPRRDDGEIDMLLALSLLVCVGPFFLPATPIFGGTKHWLPAYPVMALFAGRGFDAVVSAMRKALPDLVGPRWILAQLGLGASVCAAPFMVTVHSFPFGLSAYVPLVGGTAGGADLGLNRQFWGFTSQNAAAEYLNAKAPGNASVFIHDTTWDAWTRMQEEGRVRRDLRATGSPGDATIALVEHELHMNEVDYSIWVAYQETSPAYVVQHDGVPIVSIYRR
jgi:hypothetical protein